MMTVFWHTLRRLRGQVIGWGLALALLAALIVSLFETVMQQQEQFQQLVKSYPPEFAAFFGDLTAIGTPSGFLHVEFFAFMPVIFGIFAVLSGSGLLASDEEQGILDLILAHPISRTTLFFGRLLALIVAMSLILAIAWGGFMLGMQAAPMNLSPGALMLPLASLLAIALLWAMLALLLSMWLPSRRLAAMAAGLTLVLSYFITSLARINSSLEQVARLSPLNYYQGGNAIEGLNLSYVAGLLLAAALFVLLAWWRFTQRDIRVAGEGGWRMPRLRRRALPS